MIIYQCTAYLKNVKWSCTSSLWNTCVCFWKCLFCTNEI